MALESKIDCPSTSWMTKIVLPLKEEMASEARSLAARFNDIHPSLLLFLHRLRSIAIDNQVCTDAMSIDNLSCILYVMVTVGIVCESKKCLLCLEKHELCS